MCWFEVSVDFFSFLESVRDENVLINNVAVGDEMYCTHTYTELETLHTFDVKRNSEDT